MQYKSECIKELAAALAKAQSEMPIAELSSSNPFFKNKYADLATYIKASRPSLSKNGLAVSQLIMFDDKGEQFLQTMLLHSSGQFISSFAKINPQKADVQSLGSYLTYMKRYSYSAIIGCASGLDDDDGENSVQRTQPYTPKQVDPLISVEQALYLEDLLAESPEIRVALLSAFKIDNFSQIPLSRYEKTITWVEHQLNK